MNNPALFGARSGGKVHTTVFFYRQATKVKLGCGKAVWGEVAQASDCEGLEPAKTKTRRLKSNIPTRVVACVTQSHYCGVKYTGFVNAQSVQRRHPVTPGWRKKTSAR